MKNKPLLSRTTLQWGEKSAISILAAACLVTLAAHAEDILRFSNSDQLHGSFLGIDQDGKIGWQRDDLAAKMQLAATDVRSIVLAGDQSHSEGEYSYVRLKNDDIIPGKVISLNETSLKITSSVVGEIEIPRANVREICPQPFGSRILYAGPFSAEGWHILEPQKQPDPKKKVEPDQDEKKDGDGEQKKLPEIATGAEKPKQDAEAKSKPHWQHVGSSWYRKDGATPLARKECLTDSSLLRFRAQWRGRININLVMHADFMPPPPKNEGEDKERIDGGNPVGAGMMFAQNGQQLHYPSLGNAMVLNIYQSYLSLSRVGYNKEGKFSVQRVTQAPSSIQLQESGEALFEIRSDRAAGLMMLFVDGQYAAQWEDLVTPENEDQDNPADMMPLGNGIAFQVAGTNLPLRISDIVIADWNGVRDPAKSYIHEKRDVILLHNGTDRYSGTLERISDGNATFQSSLGKLEIPLADLAEIHFARERDEPTVQTKDGEISAVFFPIGKISGQALLADRQTIKIKNQMAGDLQLKLDRAIMLHFDDENSFLDQLNFEENHPEIPEE